MKFLLQLTVCVLLAVALLACLSRDPAFADLGEQASFGSFPGGRQGNTGPTLAISNDGNTALVGDFGARVGGNVGQGSATVFVRSASTWTAQQTLSQTGGGASDALGGAVALSGDGNTAALASDIRNTATFFTRTAGVWTEQQTVSVLGGNAIALSNDGNTAIVGAWWASPGSATVLTRSGGFWSQQQVLTGGNYFGWSVALSGNGNTAIVGDSAGSAQVFTVSGGVWTPQQTLTRPDSQRFGTRVDLSDSGNTAAVGSHGSAQASVFQRSGSVWAEQQTFSHAAGGRFGWSVGLSGDGRSLLVGAYEENISGAQQRGTISHFELTAGSWQLNRTVSRINGVAYDRFGEAVALSQDGATAIVGALSGSVTVLINGVPTAPTGVAATSGGNGQSSVSWLAPASNGGATITGYTVTSNPGGLQCSWSTGPLTCVISGLTNGVAYTFFVHATNSSGNSSPSGSSVAAVAYTTPDPPLSVSATSGGNGQSSVSWLAPASNGGATITGYTVTSNPGGLQCSWSTGPLTCTITGLTNGTAHTFTTRATNLSGEGPASAPSIAATPGYQLTISTFSGQGVITNGVGTLRCSTVCGGFQADAVTLTASAATGWSFSSWGGACAGAGPVCSLLMNQARDVTAIFTPSPIQTSVLAARAPSTPAVSKVSLKAGNVIANFKAETGAFYTIQATFKTTTTRGRCNVKREAVTCSIKLKSSGKWSITITPLRGGVKGKPYRKVVKVKATSSATRKTMIGDLSV